MNNLILSSASSCLIRTDLGCEDELKLLCELIHKLELKRYDDVLYGSTNPAELKQLYTIREFTWAYCHNPCYANQLDKDLRRKIVNCKEFLSLLARSNKQISVDNMYESWNDASDNVDDPKTPEHISYSLDNSTTLNNNYINLTPADGDLWNGMLFTHETLENLEDVTIEVFSVNSDGVEWEKTYEFKHDEIVKTCKPLSLDNEWVIFTPFKHPFILRNMNFSCRLHINPLKNTDEFRLIYGVCSEEFNKWMSTECLKLELAHGDKYIVDVVNETMDCN